MSLKSFFKSISSSVLGKMDAKQKKESTIHSIALEEDKQNGQFCSKANCHCITKLSKFFLMDFSHFIGIGQWRLQTGKH